MTDYHDYTQNQYHTNPAPPPPKRKASKKWLFILALFAGATLLVCGAGAIVLATADSKAPAFQDPTFRATPGDPALSKPPVTGGSSTSKAPAAPPAPAKKTIKNGTWTAGVDFPPGKYQMTSDAQFCAWQVYTGEQPNVTYVDPGHVGPGHYAFEFKKGQHLLTQGCGEWTPIS